MEIAVICILTGLLVYQDVRWRKTTERLTDRIQAKDLSEFKKYQEPQAKATEPKPREDQMVQL